MILQSGHSNVAGFVHEFVQQLIFHCCHVSTVHWPVLLRRTSSRCLILAVKFVIWRACSRTVHSETVSVRVSGLMVSEVIYMEEAALLSGLLWHRWGKPLIQEHPSVFTSAVMWNKIQNDFRNIFGNTPIQVETEGKKTDRGEGGGARLKKEGEPVMWQWWGNPHLLKVTQNRLLQSGHLSQLLLLSAVYGIISNIEKQNETCCLSPS